MLFYPEEPFHLHVSTQLFFWFDFLIVSKDWNLRYLGCGFWGQLNRNQLIEFYPLLMLPAVVVYFLDYGFRVEVNLG